MQLLYMEHILFTDRCTLLTASKATAHNCRSVVVLAFCGHMQRGLMMYTPVLAVGDASLTVARQSLQYGCLCISPAEFLLFTSPLVRTLTG